MDILSSVLNHFSLNANVFFSGNLCGLSDFGNDNDSKGHLHLLRSGKLTVRGKNGFEKHYVKPTVIFFPQPTRHSLFADSEDGVDLVCATINYQTGQSSPLLRALPDFLEFDIETSGIAGHVSTWLFEEAFEERNGKHLIINRLCDVFLVTVLRKVLAEGSIDNGMMAGLAHPQLSKVLVKLHERPEQHWSLEIMAEECAMSRSKFAETFKKVVRQTPAEYLTDWRLCVAQKYIAKHENMDLVANKVGYENGSALARVFKKKLGQAPTEWLKSNQMS